MPGGDGNETGHPVQAKRIDLNEKGLYHEMSVLTLPKELAGLSRPVRALLWCAVSSKKQAEEEKASLPEQEKQQRDWDHDNHGQIVELLIAPGHSRHYIDIHECAEDMAAQGVFALKKLLEYLTHHPLPFDVFICRDTSRFGRTATMLSYVLESVIDKGGVIYSMTDGWITEDNSQFANAMGGFKTTKDIRDLLASRDEGMNRRLERGLNMYGLPMSHMLIFDARGKPDHLELNPNTARLWIDLKALLLNRVPWKWIPVRLNEHGHVGENGKRLADSTLKKLLNNPYFWGHAAKDYCQDLGPWAYDEEFPLPEGVKVHRNTHPAVYTGNDAELIKAELRRRLMLVGKATSETGYAYSGLLMCAECGCSLVANPNNGYPNWRCQTRQRNPTVTFCNEKRMISDAAVRRYVNALLEQLLADGGIEIISDYGRSPD